MIGSTRRRGGGFPAGPRPDAGAGAAVRSSRPARWTDHPSAGSGARMRQSRPPRTAWAG